MSNKQIIRLTLLLSLCLYCGGLCYAVSAKTFPCRIVCLNHRPNGKFQFYANYNFLASKIKDYARQVGEDPANWKRVELHYFNHGSWTCSVYKTGESKHMPSFEFTMVNEGNQTIYFKDSDLILQK